MQMLLQKPFGTEQSHEEKELEYLKQKLTSVKFV